MKCNALLTFQCFWSTLLWTSVSAEYHISDALRSTLNFAQNQQLDKCASALDVQFFSTTVVSNCEAGCQYPGASEKTSFADIAKQLQGLELQKKYVNVEAAPAYEYWAPYCSQKSASASYICSRENEKYKFCESPGLDQEGTYSCPDKNNGRLRPDQAASSKYNSDDLAAFTNSGRCCDWPLRAAPGEQTKNVGSYDPATKSSLKTLYKKWEACSLNRFVKTCQAASYGQPYFISAASYKRIFETLYISEMGDANVMCIPNDCLPANDNGELDGTYLKILMEQRAHECLSTHMDKCVYQARPVIMSNDPCNDKNYDAEKGPISFAYAGPPPFAGTVKDNQWKRKDCVLPAEQFKNDKNYNCIFDVLSSAGQMVELRSVVGIAQNASIHLHPSILTLCMIAISSFAMLFASGV